MSDTQTNSEMMSTEIDAKELELTDDQKRIIKAQIKLNKVREYYDEIDQGNGELTEEAIEIIKVSLGEAGLLLTLAGENELASEVSNVLNAINQWQIHKDSGYPGKEAYAEWGAKNGLFSAGELNPAKEL